MPELPPPPPPPRKVCKRDLGFCCTLGDPGSSFPSRRVFWGFTHPVAGFALQKVFFGEVPGVFWGARGGGVALV